LDPKPLMSMIRLAVNKLDSNLPIYDLRTQTEQIDRTIYRDRLVTRLAGVFALLAAGLACVGLYGLLLVEVSRRTKEIGVRMALGAQRNAVLRMVVGRGIALALAGLVPGIAAALGLVRYLQTFLFDIKPTDTLTLTAVVLLQVLTASVASYIPARRATKVDPMVALRYE
jgi:ABC-type antimicrobial peptide transport system permease subunit